MLQTLQVGNPFKWMEIISLLRRTYFYEKCVGKYSKSGVGVDRGEYAMTMLPILSWRWSGRALTSASTALISDATTISNLIWKVLDRVMEHQLERIAFNGLV
jgi:hypothetical protein